MGSAGDRRGSVGSGDLVAIIAVPSGIWVAGRTELSLVFIGAAVLFLPLFVFLPKIIRLGMRADTDAAIDAFGKNERVKKVFWAVFAAVGGLVLTKILNPVTAQQIAVIITGINL